MLFDSFDLVDLSHTLSPDRADSSFPVHKALLGANKYIIETVANASTA